MNFSNTWIRMLLINRELYLRYKFDLYKIYFKSALF